MANLLEIPDDILEKINNIVNDKNLLSVYMKKWRKYHFLRWFMCYAFVLFYYNNVRFSYFSTKDIYR